MAKRILLIDSDESFAQSMQSAFGARGLAATVASNSEQGMALAKSEAPDLVVVCVEAQPTNGYMLCTRLKKDESLKGIPVILTSANATADSFEKHKKLKTRAEEYLIKPFAAEVLLEKAAGLLGIALPPAAYEEEVVTVEEDEPLGLGDLVAGEDEPVKLSDAEAAEAQGLSPPADEVVVEEEQPLEQLAEAPAQGDDEELKMFDAAFDSLSPAAPAHHQPPAPPAESDEQAFAHLRLAPPPDDAAAAPEEPPATPSLEELPAAAIAEQPALAPVIEGVDPEVHAALEQQLAQVESDLAQRTAELESARKSSGPSTDHLKFKSEANKKDKEILKLKEELNVKEKELIDLRESQTELEISTQTLREESTKREALAKALQQRADALAAAAKKFERELSAAREELKAVPALKVRLGELEAVEKAQQELHQRHAELSAQAEEHKSRATALDQELERHKSRSGELETELSGARALHESEVEQLKGEIDTLKADMDKLEQQLEAAKGDTGRAQAELEAARAEVEQVRTDVSALTGEKDILGEERDDLRRQLEEATASATRNEDRAIKAYQRIKSDEKLREKTKKALQIALQLLEEVPAGLDGDPAAASSAEKQSA